MGLLATVLLLPSGANAASSDEPVVRVGTEGTYPPFTYVDPRSQQLTGYDIEVIKAVADRAGWQLEFVQSPFDAIFPALDSNRIDVIANQVTINPEREARYLFSTPYTFSHGVVVTAADNDDIKGLDDLEGKTTAQSETSNWAQVARDAGAEVKSVEGFAEAAELLRQGRVDAIVNDNIAVLDYLASTGSKDIKIAGDAGDEVSQQALTFRTVRHRAPRPGQRRAQGAVGRRRAAEDLREVLRRRRDGGGRRRGRGEGLRHAQHRGGAPRHGVADVQGPREGHHPAHRDQLHRRA